MNYYESLGTSKSASFQQIKRAFRREIYKWHPDKNKSPHAPDRTIEIIEAWEVLGDPERRRLYDQIIEGPSTNTDISEGFKSYQREARKAASAYAERPLRDVLKRAGIGIAQWITRFSVGIAVMIPAIYFFGWLAETDSFFIYWGVGLSLWLAVVILMEYWKGKVSKSKRFLWLRDWLGF